jgi:Skp family chaperone for outer membrane proteins
MKRILFTLVAILGIVSSAAAQKIGYINPETILN